jgi:Tol biopolymer transport system component
VFGLGVIAAAGVALAAPTHAVHCRAAEPAAAALPAWSPNGERLAYTVPREETAAIAVARPGAVRPTFGSLSYDSAPVKLVWAASGGAIAFQKRTGGIEVLLLGRFGSSRELVHAEAGKTTELGDWAPDGERLVFVRDGHIHVLDVRTGEIRYLVDGLHPTWSPDGTEIAFAARDGLDLIRPDGSGLRTVVQGPHELVAIAWAPDSSRLAFVGAVIGIVPRDGGPAQYTVPAQPPLAWRANGIFYNLEQSAPVQTAPWRFDPDTGKTTRLTHFPAKVDARFAAASPDGRRIAYELDLGYRPAGVRLVGADGRGDQPLLACSGTDRADRIRGTRFNDVIRTVGGGVDRVICGHGRDIVDADRRDIVARDCERVSRS